MTVTLATGRARLRIGSASTVVAMSTVRPGPGWASAARGRPQALGRRHARPDHHGPDRRGPDRRGPDHLDPPTTAVAGGAPVVVRAGLADADRRVLRQFPHVLRDEQDLAVLVAAQPSPRSDLHTEPGHLRRDRPGPRPRDPRPPAGRRPPWKPGWRTVVGIEAGEDLVKQLLGEPDGVRARRHPRSRPLRRRLRRARPRRPPGRRGDVPGLPVPHAALPRALRADAADRRPPTGSWTP